MKKALLPLAMAALLPSVVNADVTVYGRANVSLQNADEYSVELLDNSAKIELVSNASRIGLKGSESVNDSLKVIYQFEYQTEVDDGSGSAGTFSQRNIYVGLQGSAGTVIAGLFDTPLKVVQEKVDLFNDLEGDITNIFNGEIRARNIVQYTTPQSWGPFSSAVAYVTHEAEDVDDGVSASVSYGSETLFVGVAADSDVQPGVDTMRVVARVTLGPVQLGALYETFDDGVIDEDGALVSAMWNFSQAWSLKAQYGESEIKAPGSEAASLGVDYRLTKSATLYSYYSVIENETTRDDNYLGVGLDYRF